jgi:hypothetical protein
MERFPLDQLITFLVFVIIALSQVWTKLREQRQQKKEKTVRRTITRTSPSQAAPKEKKLSDSFDDLFEALGIPPQHAAPPPPQPPRLPIEKVVKTKLLHLQPEVIEVKPPLPVPTPLLLKKEKLPRLTAWDKTLLPSASHKKIIRALHDRKQIQQAILLKEILGLPKALASDFP